MAAEEKNKSSPMAQSEPRLEPNQDAVARSQGSCSPKEAIQPNSVEAVLRGRMGKNFSFLM
ncbi:hypothetical protein LDENG_00193740 [Lucifuga dentata]|nr:hypothetical protein LDENG_00193740 [Lucifuga dentata]